MGLTLYFLIYFAHLQHIVLALFFSYYPDVYIIFYSSRSSLVWFSHSLPFHLWYVRLSGVKPSHLYVLHQ